MRRLLVIALLAACTPDKDQQTGSIGKEDFQEVRKDASPQFVMHLDSGNAAYRRNDFQKALTHYRAAIDIDDDEPAPWFGIYMTQLALRNAPAADSALNKARKLAPGASILR